MFMSNIFNKQKPLLQQKPYDLLTWYSIPPGWKEVSLIGFLLLWPKVWPLTPVHMWNKVKNITFAFRQFVTFVSRYIYLFIFPLEKVAVFSVSASWTGIKPPAFLSWFANFLKQQSRTWKISDSQQWRLYNQSCWLTLAMSK